jgi:hypothetical protein
MSQHDQDLQHEQQLLQHFREHGRGEPSAAVDALILAAAQRALDDAQPRRNWLQRLHAWLFGVGSSTRWSMAVAGLAVFGIGLNLALHTREQLPQAYDIPAPASAPALQEMAPKVAREAQPDSRQFEQRKAETVEKKAAARHGAMEPNAAFLVSPPAAAAPRAMAPARPQPAPVEALADSAAAPAEADAADAKARDQVAAQAFAKAGSAVEARAQAPAGNAVHEELSEDQLAETLGHSDVDEAPPLELQLRNVLNLRQAGQHADADRLLAMLRQQHPQRDLDAELKRLQGEVEKPDSSR